MGAERQNQVQAQPEEIGEGVTVQLNNGKSSKPTHTLKWKLHHATGRHQPGGYQLATFVGGPRTSGKHLP